MTRAKLPDPPEPPEPPDHRPKLRVVGSESRLPAPTPFLFHKAGWFDLTVLTEAEWRRLGPEDREKDFFVVRPGIFARFDPSE